MTSSTSSNVTIFDRHGARYSRERLQVEKIIPYEQTDQRYERFAQILQSTFGPAIEPLLTQHYASLMDLASRAVYLFEFFGVCASYLFN